MGLYDYTAFDKEGKKIKGRVEAGSDRQARERLREQGVILSSIAEAKPTRKDALIGENLVTFTRLLAQLVESGVPLYESLLALEEQFRRERFHACLTSICDQIQSGSTLSKAMKEHPMSFDQLYVSMVAAGESSGALAKVLHRLANHLEKQQKLKSQLVTAMIYPMILATFSIVVIALLLLFVVPSIETVFEGRQLNGFSQFVINISHLARGHGWWVLPMFGILISYGVWWFFTEKGQSLWHRYSLQVPLVKGIILQSAMARFCRTLSTLLEGGVPLVEGLEISRGVMGNRVLQDEIAAAEKAVIEGSSFSKELQKSAFIPPMVSRMAQIGEETASANVMFAKIADVYEGQLDKTLSRIMALAQPVILMIMGMIIGSILLAILLPLTDVSQLTG